MNCRYGTPHGFPYPFMGPLAALHPIEPTGRVRLPTPLTIDSSMRVEDPLVLGNLLANGGSFRAADLYGDSSAVHVDFRAGDVGRLI